MRTFCKAQFGFTIIEVIVAVAIFAVVGVGTIVLIGNMFTTGGKLSVVSADTDQSRRIALRLMQELRNAVSSSTGAYALGEASNQQIVFYSNIDGGTDIERLRYYISGGRLYRGVVKPTGTPYTYNLGSESSSVVLSNIANGANPLFYYYSGTYTGTETPLTQPINLTQVRHVKMDLRVFNKSGIATTNYFTVTMSGTIRSLKSNLGE